MGEQFRDFLTNVSARFKTEYPHLIRNKCIKCGECADIDVCSENAVTFEPKNYPKFDLSKCNSCFICVDICTYSAIIPKKERLLGLFTKQRNENKQ